MVLREIFVALSVRVTVAPTTMPPVESVTSPATVPELLPCEYSAEGIKANRQERATTSKTTRLLTIPLPPGWAKPGPFELDTPRPLDCQKVQTQEIWKTP